VCDLAPFEDVASDDARIESFGNAVAGEALVPGEYLSQPVDTRVPREWDMELLADLSKHFSVSREVILRRLLNVGATTQAYYAQMREAFEKEYEELAKRKRETKGGPGPAVMAVRNLGKPLVRLVLDAYARDRISLSSVCDYLGIKVKHLTRVEQIMLQGEAA
jgi:Zn-dependent peptidase ImmA (M78 family)